MASNYENLLSICERRKSVRQFSDKAVAAADVERILKIAYTSPYASGRKNWELIAVNDAEQIKNIAALVKNSVSHLEKKIKEDYKEGFRQYAESFVFFENAPVLIIPAFRTAPALSVMLNKPDGIIDQWERDNYVKSISCAAMLVLLAAESLGLGGCYMTGPLLAEDEIGKLIKTKTGRNIGAIIPIGYVKSEDS